MIILDEHCFGKLDDSWCVQNKDNNVTTLDKCKIQYVLRCRKIITSDKSTNQFDTEAFKYSKF